MPMSPIVLVAFAALTATMLALGLMSRRPTSSGASTGGATKTRPTSPGLCGSLCSGLRVYAPDGSVVGVIGDHLVVEIPWRGHAVCAVLMSQVEFQLWVAPVRARSPQDDRSDTDRSSLCSSLRRARTVIPASST